MDFGYFGDGRDEHWLRCLRLRLRQINQCIKMNGMFCEGTTTYNQEEIKPIKAKLIQSIISKKMEIESGSKSKPNRHYDNMMMSLRSGTDTGVTDTSKLVKILCSTSNQPIRTSSGYKAVVARRWLKHTHPQRLQILADSYKYSRQEFEHVENWRGQQNWRTIRDNHMYNGIIVKKHTPVSYDNFEGYCILDEGGETMFPLDEKDVETYKQ